MKKSGTKKKSKKKAGFRFSLRYKIGICIILPIVFMLIFGILAYRKAANGMNEKYRESTIQTIKMVMNNIDMSCSFVEAEGTKYAYNANYDKYFIGIYNDNPTEKKKILDSLRTDILSSQLSNPFINDIHIVTKAGINMISTRNYSANDGIFDSYRESAVLSGG